MYLSRLVIHDQKADVARDRLSPEHYANFSTITRILLAEGEVHIVPCLHYRAFSTQSKNGIPIIDCLHDRTCAACRAFSRLFTNLSPSCQTIRWTFSSYVCLLHSPAPSLVSWMLQAPEPFSTFSRLFHSLFCGSIHSKRSLSRWQPLFGKYR